MQVTTGANLIIESRYPHIFRTLCVVYNLNLALKNLCDPTEKPPQYAQCKWIFDLVGDVLNIRNFIANHSMVWHYPFIVTILS